MVNFIEQNNYAVLCVDAIILNDEGKILLLRRAMEPQKGVWTLLGGRMKIIDDNLESSLIRRAKEETGLEVEVKYLLDVIADPDQNPPADPRFYAVQVIYVAKAVGGSLQKTKFVDEFQWLNLEEVLKQGLGFNHNQIINLYYQNTANLIPAERTMYRDNFGTEYSYWRDDYVHFGVKAINWDRDRGILLGRRSQKPYSGLWDFPGGHMFINESVEKCLKREIREELGVKCKIGKLFQVYSDKGMSPKYSGAIALYFVDLETEKFEKNIELDEFKFFPFAELPKQVAYHMEMAIEDICNLYFKTQNLDNRTNLNIFT